MASLETKADIIAEMRQLVSGVPPNNLFVTCRKINQWADRLEAAKPETAHNAAAMREALVEVVRLDSSLKGRVLKGNKDAINLLHAVSVATSALAAPPRTSDCYEDGDDAFAAWHDSLKDGDVVGVRNAFKWLFATAAQQGNEK